VSDTERRFVALTVEVRAESERRSIGGYASVFNRRSSDLGGFVEMVDPGAFEASRAEGWPGVVARYNHDDNMLLGTSDSGTLQLDIDETGLRYDVDMPAARADVFELVQRGDVRKSSFAFIKVEDSWESRSGDLPLRVLHSVRLVDVAPVNTPAYPDSSAGLRSLAGHMDADPNEVRALAQRGELRRLFKRTDLPVTTSGAAARAQILSRRYR
jgi:uncharacterized protein